MEPSGDPMIDILMTWLTLSPVSARYAYLEAHPELIHASIVQTLMDISTHFTDDGEIVASAESAHLILHYILAREGATPSIRDAYINAAGALQVLSFPWLETLLQEAEHLRNEIDPHATSQAQVALWERELAQAASLEAPLEADLLFHRGQASMDIRGPQQAIAQENAIADFYTALDLLSPERFPHQRAAVHLYLGMAYEERLFGETRANIEEAIAHYHQALDAWTRDEAPLEWATALNNLGNAYSKRIEGDSQENIRTAIMHYEQALLEWTRPRVPLDWAMAMNNLGEAYRKLETDKSAHLERARQCFEDALQERPRNRVPLQWATTHNNLGATYFERFAGDRNTNLMRARDHFIDALLEWTRARVPLQWAKLQHNLGAVFALLPSGDRHANLQRALTYFQHALEERPKALVPQDYFSTNWNLFLTYEELADLGGAWQALQEAQAAYRDILTSARSEEALRVHIARYTEYDVALRGAQLALQMTPPDLLNAILCLEEGRGQSLRAALHLDTVTDEGIRDPDARTRMAAFLHARDDWLMAQTRFRADPSQRNQVEVAYQRMDTSRNAIREQDDPEFLSSIPSLTSIVNSLASPQEALVYIVAEQHQGYALFLRQDQDGHPVASLERFPQLTSQGIKDLLERHYEGRTYGGLLFAQLSSAFTLVQEWGASVVQAMTALSAGCSFCVAGRTLQQAWQSIPEKSALCNTPFAQLREEQLALLETLFNQLVLEIEADMAMQALSTWMGTALVETALRCGVQQLMMVPYGYLALFPLTALPVAPFGEPRQRLGDRLTVGVVPSGSVLVIARERAQHWEQDPQGTVLTVGDPEGAGPSLLFAEAEAGIVKRQAQASGRASILLTKYQATRKAVEDAIPHARILHFATHGALDVLNPRASRIWLAHGQSISLDELLTRRLAMNARLLILSACESGLQGALQLPQEIFTLPTGFLQAGCAGVIASLWPVDDEATFLLISRFFQMYFHAQLHWSPAQCLARAIRWLREEATYAELAQYDPSVVLSDGEIQHLLQTPERSLTAQVESDPITSDRLIAMVDLITGQRRRGNRYTAIAAIQHVQETMRQRRTTTPDEVPYRFATFWAAFYLTGV